MIRNCIDIDINEINKGIDFYRANHNGEYPNYLVMNTKTYFTIKEINIRSGIFSFIEEPKDFVTWHGIPIAVCDALEFGEVDFV